MAFAGTTIYGQLVSVYQYPGVVLVVLASAQFLMVLDQSCCIRAVCARALRY